ncbi:hypothetical protein AGDE_15850 [Angomonas deanei]|nr:hypothetical protein AGDE_15850 [Angomonas deanei]|eukprot:EPY18271.1 hypothetical protein AGDE_15850 [Angomonas deanei]
MMRWWVDTAVDISRGTEAHSAVLLSISVNMSVTGVLGSFGALRLSRALPSQQPQQHSRATMSATSSTTTTTTTTTTITVVLFLPSLFAAGASSGSSVGGAPHF